MVLLQRQLKSGVKGSFSGLFVMCLIFGLSIRVSVEQSFVQHCLSVITDHYYLTFFMIPLFLVLCFFVIEDDSEMVIVRYKTYFRYFSRKWAALAVISLLFMLVQMLAVAASGIGLPSGNQWVIVNGSTGEELFIVLSRYFSSPLLCLAGASAYMLAGLCVTTLIAIWTGHFLTKPWATKIILLLYLLSVGKIKIGAIRELPIMAFNHLLILHHNLIGAYSPPIIAASAVLLTALLLWTAKRYWHRQFLRAKRAAKGITPYYCKELVKRKNLIILGAVVAAMLLWKHLQSVCGMDGTDWIVSVFAGHGVGGFWLLGFIEMLLLTGTPIYLLAVFIERMTTGHSLFITIRLHKRRQILSGLLASSCLFILLYGALLFILPLSALLAAGSAPDYATVSLLGVSVLLKLFDITAQVMFFMAVYCLSGQTTVGFLSLFGLNLLCVLPLSMMKYLPFGLSSLARINLPQTGALGISAPYAINILAVMSVLLFCWLFMNGYKRLPKN